ncbi:MAG: endonuclease/exonuclease/phosphatase family protein [Bacteroidaceae bacterium]|nr:endonuclease/exonuclease/phosphatase family protein [Bacteroidaceae bacterium]
MGKRAIVVYAKLVTVVFTVMTALLSLYALRGGYVTPVGHTFHACSVVAIPLLMIVNFVAFLYWALVRRKLWVIVPLIPLLCSWNYRKTIFQFGSADEAIHENILTVGSYNVRMFSSEASGYIATDIMQAMHNDNCDIVCLQEYRDEVPGTNSNVRATVRDLYEYSVVGDGNMAIFSRYPIKAHQEFKFEYSNNGWQWADIQLDSKHTIRVVNVHMETTGVNSALHQIAKESYEGIDLDDMPIDPSSLDAQERSMFNSRVNNDRIYRLLLGNYAFGLNVRSGQAIHIANELREVKQPIILAGDFNDVPYSYTYHTLLGNLVDGFTTGGHGWGSTYRQAKGLMRIDYIFADESYECYEYHTLDLTYSDHNPVVARYDIPNAKKE